MLPVLETILSEFGRRAPSREAGRRSEPREVKRPDVHPLTLHLTSNG
jgi:hypothetical protein